MGEGAPVRWVNKTRKDRFAVQLAAFVRVLTGRDSHLAREPRFPRAIPLFRARTRSRCDRDFPRFADPYFETRERFASFVLERSAARGPSIFALGATTTLMTSEGGWFIAD